MNGQRDRRSHRVAAPFDDVHGQFPRTGLEREAKAGGRRLAHRLAGTEQQHAGTARFRRHGEPAQFFVAGAAEPREKRPARPGAQHLLRRPQGVPSPRRAHHGELREIDSGGGERGRIRQVRRRQPDDALARGGKPRERGKRKLQLADAFLRTKDLGEPPDRPAAAGQLTIEIGVTRGNGTGKSCRRGAAPDLVAL